MRAWRPLSAVIIALGFALPAATGCATVKRVAINKLGDSLADTGTTYAADDDPELVGQALPFGLKLVESLLAQSPKHQGLLFAAASGFTQYGYVYVQQEADMAASVDVERAAAARLRARRLYLRARDYGLRALDGRYCTFSRDVRRDPKTAVRVAKVPDVPLLYWTAAAWGSAISVSKDDPDLIAEQPMVEALIDRAFALDPDFDSGAIHGFLIAYESARQGASGDPNARARWHFDRAVALTKGQLAAPFVSFAESISVADQDRAEFRMLLTRALAIDPNARPEWRLQNVVTQRRARWLAAHEDDLFIK